MSVLILKNIAKEGAGTIERFLRNSNVPFDVVELGEGEAPPPLEGYDSLLMMGGPMGVYEADEYPFLKTGFKAIEAALKRDMRVLGVCLGAQSLAHVLGARVFKGHTKEIGWLDIELTAQGLEDPAMKHLAAGGNPLKVFHWHGDTFDMPEGAARLASSREFENQAFVYGGNVYGLQFHIEVTPDVIAQWFKGEPGEADILRDTEKYHSELDKKAEGFYRGFFDSKKVREGVGLG